MLQDNDFSSQPACYREKKNTLTFSCCSVIKHLLVLLSENWSALLWTYKLLHIPSSWQHTSSVRPRLSKNFLFGIRILPGTSLFPSLCSQISLVWDNVASPACIFCKWGASTAVWDWSIHHHINMLPSCPHSPCFSLLWEVTQQCSGSLCLSLSPSQPLWFYSGLPFICPHLVLMWCAFKKCINKGCNYCASVLGMDI